MKTRARIAAGLKLLLAVAALLSPLAAVSGCRKGPPPTPQVVINGRSWYVDLARTPQEQYTGLSGRGRLESGAGMLFIFDQPRELTFCMRGCDVPIDIAFVSADLRVVSVQTMAVEPDRAGRVPYPSGQPAQYALEVAAGELSAAGVKPGDLVRLVGTGSPN